MKREEDTPWQYKPNAQPGTDVTDDGPSDPGGSIMPEPKSSKDISWEAPEFIEHHHSPGWYAALVVITLALAAGIFLLSSRDIAATAIVLVLGIIIGIFASHQPTITTYSISGAGLRVGQKLYKYSDYKSFSIASEDPLYSVNLTPLKRLSPPVAAYFNPADQKKIVNALGEYLPYEKRGLDAVDRLARRLRL
jgi:hypothetical protein